MSEFRLYHPKPQWAIWLLCRSDGGDIMHPKSFVVKRRKQPMEERRPRKLFDHVGWARSLAPRRKGAKAFAPWREAS
jgi:hypothetical protein